ncbi:hypothetical protein GCM10027297_28460 [Parahaliea aestuarii]
MKGLNRNALAFILAVTLASIAGQARAVLMLTDSAVFSANPSGENWNGWIWNTQGGESDDRWNLYYSSSLDPQNPVFLNSKDGATTNIAIALTPGTHLFSVYGESVIPNVDPLQHFVLSLYFGGNQTTADISGLYGSSCNPVCPASHPNGLDLYGSSGLSTPNAQEAGTLSFVSGDYEVTLSDFIWILRPDIDQVWPYWDNSPDYSNGSNTPDFFGRIQLDVRALNNASPVPLSNTLTLFGLGLLLLRLVNPRRA